MFSSKTVGLIASAKAKAISFALLAPIYFLSPSAAFAASGGDSFQGMNDATSGAKGVVQDTFAGVLWVLAILPLGIGFFAAMKMKEYLENKEENNQHEPRWMKFGKVVFAFGGGVMITFILYGVLGKTFMGYSFADTWNQLVMSFWKDVVVNGLAPTAQP